tara:strand:+ start:8804 stop:8950 length:147 start_codon:yes stop_codon:yes gene_type:complete
MEEIDDQLERVRQALMSTRVYFVDCDNNEDVDKCHDELNKLEKLLDTE